MFHRGGEYRLTYDDSNLPRHYAWKVTSRLEGLDQLHKDLTAGRRGQSSFDRDLETEVRNILRDLDGQGRWISTYSAEPLVGQPNFAQNTRYISSAVFSHNLGVLSEYLMATQ